MQTPNLAGKTALITGGSRGIGRTVALMLGQGGARVVITARNASQLEAVASEIETAGGQAVPLAADLGKPQEVAAALRQAGPIDILINNAGIVQPIAPVAAVDPQEWAEDIAVNLTGVFLTCHYALPHMLEADWGRIINVSSGAARGGTAGWSAYSSAKAGVEAFTRTLAVEVEGRGVRVNAVRPGIVDTEMQVEIRAARAEDFSAENVARFRGYKERGLLRAPEDPARLILWLLGPEADGVNGEVLAIDDPVVAARIGVEVRGR